MNDDNSQNADGPSRKTFFERLGQFFQADPKDRQELVDVFRDSEQNALIDHDTRDMLEGVMQISDMRVRDIMIPRSQMVTVERSQSLEAIINIIIDAQHSRYPVISDDKDHVEGILLAKDLLRYLRPDAENFDIEKVLRPAVVVPESKRVDRLLKEFQEERYHMAIVIDEFGGVSGVVTIEDILEEIVGEIEDEYDEDDEQEIRQLSRHTFAVKALTTLEDFNTHFGSQFQDDVVDTIGGLVMTSFGHLPDRGEEVDIEHFHFKVTSADSRRIIQLQVTIPDSSEPQSESD
ncbi:MULTISPECIES: CNNM family magnesium/cobalt transport protein CorC [Salinivibrio]|uniref:Magnesium and cobalt efflux protein CorC n=2 Tax=Salinivibrio TaxID=51366 RepID=A0ABY7LE25_9GAMM|nr:MULTISPECIES: CNNM family magnesium/cobalt transport protein CorC [Salinivibrio]ODQ00900.1 magnesium/cobalt efflux protein [Salinivibrio sp. DV]OOF08808.1 magnesium/cobalt efflux protein [Salinivibrio sp. PR5]OOF09387.1 magnesium/cobalt efflux protein [Salinivibrio sp. PR919]OOF18237.1 magnesium/cobalt efflux protein [Salinivibrio sp. PR932]OOF21501.1 magnesium/cobalt efflux protein [Salinivibrio sp. IB574]